MTDVGTGNVVCGPLNGFGMFGWKMEAGDSSFPDEMQGGVDYGVTYLRHMAGQGFKTGYAVRKQPSQTLVCLKTWEPWEDEPEWLMDTSTAVIVSYWRRRPPLALHQALFLHHHSRSGHPRPSQSNDGHFIVRSAA